MQNWKLYLLLCKHKHTHTTQEWRKCWKITTMPFGKCLNDKFTKICTVCVCVYSTYTYTPLGYLAMHFIFSWKSPMRNLVHSKCRINFETPYTYIVVFTLVMPAKAKVITKTYGLPWLNPHRMDLWAHTSILILVALTTAHIFQNDISVSERSFTLSFSLRSYFFSHCLCSENCIDNLGYDAYKTFINCIFPNTKLENAYIFNIRTLHTSSTNNAECTNAIISQ